MLMVGTYLLGSLGKGADRTLRGGREQTVFDVAMGSLYGLLESAGTVARQLFLSMEKRG